MRMSIKQFAAKENFPFIVFAVLLIIFHIPLNTNFGDDLAVRAIWEDGVILQHFADVWSMWSSRIIVFIISEPFAGLLPQFVWKAVNICVIVMAAVFVSKIFVCDAANRENISDCNNRYNSERVNYRRTCNAMIVSFFLMYNLYEMSSTGWVASTANYMWPAASGLYVLLSIKKALCLERLKKYEYPLTVAALIYASNQEQVCAVLLTIYLYYIGYAVRAKLIRHELIRVNRFVLLQSFLCMASLIYILLWPANYLRYEAETARWFPAYSTLTFLEKVSIGISSTLNYFVMTPSVLFLVLSLLLSIGIFAKYKSLWIRIISVTPLFVNTVAFIYVFTDYFMADGTFTLKNPRDIFQLYGILGTADAARFYIPHILYAAMISVFAACLYIFFNDRKKFFLPFCVLLLGISSRVMMGLSPTVFTSSYRTYLILNFSFIITAFIVYQNIAALVKTKTLRYINVLIVLIALANYSAIPIGYQIVKPFFGRP